ncbi:hypothetical protein [Flavobacterium sp.]|uniref:hypothetical protein n=1 Tax=Flavobacterium sp. TaxID=239 RepID=UPI00286DE031|nr:hypothetical protein [Flavobacterium sp.]
MKNQIILLIAFVTFSANAQFGNLLNKAKEKLTEKKSEVKSDKTINTEKAMSTENLSIETVFEFPYQGTDYSSPNKSSLASIIASKDILNPYNHIRKEGETGIVHFAKDYPDLKPVIEPFENNLKIEFFEALPNSGKETFTNSFSSKSHIYARITALSGTIKDVFKLDEKNPVIDLKMVLYDDQNQRLKYGNGNNPTYIALSSEQANLKSLDIDIMPHTMKYSIYKGNSGDAIYYSPFPNMHNKEIFDRNGAFKVGVFFNSKTRDDWGKELDGDGIVYANTFDYEFSAKDVATIMSEQEAVFEANKNGIRTTKKDLPEEWKLKSNPITMGMTQAQITSLYLNNYEGGESALKVIKFFAHPSSGGWTIQKNEYGIPLYRYSNQFYTLFVKNINTNDCYFQRFSLRQQYNGGGTYDAVIGDITYDVNFTECDKMK